MALENRDAFFQVLLIAELVGVRALLIHAETPTAVAFYRHIDRGFMASPTDPLHLILLLKDLRAAHATGRDAIAKDVDFTSLQAQ